MSAVRACGAVCLITLIPLGYVMAVAAMAGQLATLLMGVIP